MHRTGALLAELDQETVPFSYIIEIASIIKPTPITLVHPRKPADTHLHADGESETGQSEVGNEVEGRGDTVVSGEFLVGLGHGLGWLGSNSGRRGTSWAS